MQQSRKLRKKEFEIRNKEDKEEDKEQKKLGDYIKERQEVLKDGS